MNNKIIAYNVEELEKKKIISTSIKLFKSGLISEKQLIKIKEKYTTKLYTPSFLIKMVLFIVSVFGLSSALGLSILGGLVEYKILSLISGILLIFITEKVFIKNNFHFKSGVTEAGIYTGLLLIAYGILGFDHKPEIIYPIVGFFLALFTAVRYLDYLALILTIVFLAWFVFVIVMDGILEPFLPFIFMIFSALIFWCSQIMEKKFSNELLNNQFIILKTLALILFYLAGNYYVVRELSISLMGLKLAENENIPFAWIFYILNTLIPIAYLFWGIKNKTMLFIRVALLTFALTFITFQYYFLSNFKMLSITIFGGILIIIALVLFNYLKQIRGGFTSDKLIDNALVSKNLVALLASQTLGGMGTGSIHSDTNQEGFNEGFGGGEFGGGGADADW